jgi:hypothetical protein
MSNSDSRTRPNQVIVERDPDVLNGLDEIAAFIGRNKRQTHYLTSTKRIPTTKLGPRTIVGSKKKISAALKGDA